MEPGKFTDLGSDSKFVGADHLEEELDGGDQPDG